jgi:hypothetical protein
MQNALSAKGRKMVTIIDPHIKKDSGYGVYQQAHEKGSFFVQTKVYPSFIRRLVVVQIANGQKLFCGAMIACFPPNR